MSNNPNNFTYPINFQSVQQNQFAQNPMARVMIINPGHQHQPQSLRFEEQRMQIEDNYSNPFCEIEKEQVSQKLQQQLIEYSNGIKQKINYFEPLITNYEKIQRQISSYSNNSSYKNFSDNNMDLKLFLDDINQYVKNHKLTLDKINNLSIQKMRLNQSQNNLIDHFLIAQEIEDQLDDLQFLEQMMSDCKLLEMINLVCQADKYQKDYVVIRALQEKQQKVQDYYEQIKKIDLENQFSLGVEDFNSFLQLLNQYYEYQALYENNKSQIKAVYSEDIVTFKNYANEKNLYLFYHNQIEKQCIIIEISQQQIQALILAKMRPILLEILKAVENNAQISSKLLTSCTFNDSVELFLQMVGVKASQKEIKKFLIRFQNYQKNEFLDVFEFREVMFTKQN